MIHVVQTRPYDVGRDSPPNTGFHLSNIGYDWLLTWAWVKFDKLPQIWDLVDIATVPVAQTHSQNMFGNVPKGYRFWPTNTEISENWRFGEDPSCYFFQQLGTHVAPPRTNSTSKTIDFGNCMSYCELSAIAPLWFTQPFFQHPHVVTTYHCDWKYSNLSYYI